VCSARHLTTFWPISGEENFIIAHVSQRNVVFTPKIGHFNIRKTVCYFITFVLHPFYEAKAKHFLRPSANPLAPVVAICTTH
jgi:hypothetical protein